MAVYPAAGLKAGRTWRTGRAGSLSRQFLNWWTTVTAIGMNSGDSTIRKITIGKNIGFLAFSAERNCQTMLPGKLFAEFVGKNL
jgi:hypothetical protein